MNYVASDKLIYGDSVTDWGVLIERIVVARVNENLSLYVTGLDVGSVERCVRLVM